MRASRILGDVWDVVWRSAVGGFYAGTLLVQAVVTVGTVF